MNLIETEGKGFLTIFSKPEQSPRKQWNIPQNPNHWNPANFVSK